MFSVLLAAQIAMLILLGLLLFRQRGTRAVPADLRLQALLAADVPAQLARNDERGQSMERLLRSELAQLRQETGAAAARLHDSADLKAEALRTEMLRTLAMLAESLRALLDTSRDDQAAEADRLRMAIEAQLGGFGRRFQEFTTETSTQRFASNETLHSRLADLARTQGDHQERLRVAVEHRLDRLGELNAIKLEEMRLTVDEKLHTTLQSRLTESFGAVTDQLTKVHTGLGEMSKLSAGVDDLSRIFTNVKSRGGFAEVQLGMLLGQMLAPNQYRQNVKVKPNTGEMVEYAVVLPTPQGEVLLPVDAKFPREAWERLETAYVESPEDLASAGRAFEAAIRTEGRRICDKYIDPPATSNFAIMFLPTESLYAE
ncbi:MAG: DNA recombination protein RmuC, partial [Rhodospirillales bacterium]|nr:DNA recombination protein RmuC [Acetobacter sp.]